MPGYHKKRWLTRYLRFAGAVVQPTLSSPDVRRTDIRPVTRDATPQAVHMHSPSSRSARAPSPSSNNDRQSIANASPSARSSQPAILQQPLNFPPPVPPYPPNQQSYNVRSGRARRPTQSKRAQSASGGLSVVLGETESWSDLAQKDTTLPADAKELLDKGKEKPTGMLGFLSRKKGRGASPKPMERGILSGKEGGRVIVSNG